ncbi:MAG: type 1 glutamine amidotransferase [Methylobacillus sp.]|jgi:GMP synthase-like glutamine amidotransferase|nr:type 1 glutamine amidotransferase [Methylobacillus sp.]
MKPVVIIQFSPTEGPGHCAEFLTKHGIPWKLVRIDQRDPLPRDTTEFSGMVMMGGPMSVNDPLPWIPQLQTLMREAVQKDVPLLGHCLGGQFIATALGGSVTNNHCKEMGWHEVRIEGGEAARPWFGDRAGFTTFQWHYQTFSIPPQTTRVLGSRWCANQAFVLGPHIAFQSHIETTAAMVRAWLSADAAEVEAAASADSVQSPDEMLRELEANVAALNRVAEGVYGHWIKGLKCE